MAHAYIVDALRTPGGRRKAALAGVHAADLGTIVLDALVARTGIDPAAIEDVIVDRVSQAGVQPFAFGRNGRYGLQTMYEGGGMANVTIVAMLEQ